jgi:hypothetical protein
MHKSASENFSILEIFHTPGLSAPFRLPLPLWLFFASTPLFFPQFFPLSLHRFSFHQYPFRSSCFRYFVIKTFYDSLCFSFVSFCLLKLPSVQAAQTQMYVGL